MEVVIGTLDNARIDALQKHIEAQWRSRAKTQDLKHGSAKYLKAEVEFFVGAMAALQALDSASGQYLTSLAPLKWTIAMLSGRPILAKE